MFYDMKVTVTSHNVEAVADTLATIVQSSIQDSDRVDVSDIQQTFSNIVKVASPSPNVGKIIL